MARSSHLTGGLFTERTRRITAEKFRRHMTILGFHSQLFPDSLAIIYI
jgi:hypothetical protein